MESHVGRSLFQKIRNIPGGKLKSLLLDSVGCWVLSGVEGGGGGGGGGTVSI